MRQGNSQTKCVNNNPLSQKQEMKGDKSKKYNQSPPAKPEVREYGAISVLPITKYFLFSSLIIPASSSSTGYVGSSNRNARLETQPPCTCTQIQNHRWKKNTKIILKRHTGFG